MAGCPGHPGCCQRRGQLHWVPQSGKSPALWGLERGAGCRPIPHLTHTHTVRVTPVSTTSSFQKVLPSLLATLKGEIRASLSRRVTCGSGPSLRSSPQPLRKPSPLTDLGWSKGASCGFLETCFGGGPPKEVKPSSITHGSVGELVRGHLVLGYPRLLQCRRSSYALPIPAPQVKATRIQVPSPLDFHLGGLALSLLVPINGHLYSSHS